MGEIVNVSYRTDIEKQVLEIVKEALDCADVLSDLARVNLAMDRLRNCFDNTGVWQLDRELRRKYPCIEEITKVVQTLLPPLPFKNNNNTGSLPEIELLKQDYHGIICGTAIKKGLIHEVKQYIRSVDRMD